MAVTLDQIKADLPDWPDDVIEQWLLKLANRGPDTGWPPPNPLGNHAWKHIITNPLPWWNNVSWKLEVTDCDIEKLSTDTSQIVLKINIALTKGLKNVWGDDDTRLRFNSALQYVLKHGAFPKPLVAMKVPSGLSVLDGNHRIAAHFFSQNAPESLLEKLGVKRPPREQEIWIGAHNLGETLGS
jgi:hypothetical protein